MTLKSLDTTAIATRTLSLYRAYLEEGLPEYRARAAALGELLMEADDLKVRGEIDFLPPGQTALSGGCRAEGSAPRSLVDDLEAGHGGFAPGSKGWEASNDCT